MSVVKKLFIAFAGLIVLLAILTAVTPQGRTAFKAIMFVPEVVPSIPIKPQQWFFGKPARTEIKYPLAAGEGIANLYQPPGKGKHAAVLLFLGVNPAGRDDPRVVGLANGLARAGMIVMVPWSESMTKKRIDPNETDNLVHAFQYLKNREGVDANRVGMGGFCVGASLAMVAAEDPRISSDVKFLNFFGGYFNASDLLKAISAKESFYDGVIEPWQPDSLTREVMVTELINGLSDPNERDMLSKALLNGDSNVATDLDGLSPAAQAVYKLANGVSLDEADALIQKLPKDTLDKLTRVSPSTNLSTLSAKVLIMQNREDNLIPVEESRRLADVLRASGKSYLYTEFSFFQHVDPTKAVNPLAFLRESFKLITHMYNVLRYTS